MAAEGPKYDVEMKTKVCLFLLLLPIITIGCSRPEEESTTHEQAMQIRDIARYKLYPTQNIWTFIKVDTQTGQLWQVQYSVNDDSNRTEYDLNPKPLITNNTGINGRFNLYPTQNIYNFILLDQVDGRLWQVQWSLEESNRAILPIKK